MDTSEQPAPRTTIRYDGANGRTTAVVLKDSSILEVKRDGNLVKNHYATYGDWLATLPEGAEGALTKTAKVRNFGDSMEPTTDVEWMQRVYPRPSYINLTPSLNDLLEYRKKTYDIYKSIPTLNPETLASFQRSYEKIKANVEKVGGPDSEAAKERKPKFYGKPFWILSEEGGKPEAFYLGRTQYYNLRTNDYENSDLLFFYKGKQGTTFAEVGVPVGADGWPNLWRIRGTEFKAVPKPV